MSISPENTPKNSSKQWKTLQKAGQESCFYTTRVEVHDDINREVPEGINISFRYQNAPGKFGYRPGDPKFTPDSGSIYYAFPIIR